MRITIQLDLPDGALAEVLANAMKLAGGGAVPGVDISGQPESRMLTLAEAAKELRISYSTLQDTIRRGELPAVSFGRAKRVRASDLAAFLEQRAERSITPAATLRSLRHEPPVPYNPKPRGRRRA